MESTLRSELDKRVELNEIEVFTAEQIKRYVNESNQEIEKSIDKADLMKGVADEVKSFTPVLVYDDNTLEKSIRFIRPAQIRWDTPSGDDIQKSRSGVYMNTHLNRKMGRVGRKYGSEGKGGEEGDEISWEEQGEDLSATVGDHKFLIYHFNAGTWILNVNGTNTIKGTKKVCMAAAEDLVKKDESVKPEKKGDEATFQRGDEVVVGKNKMSVIGYDDKGSLKVMNAQNEKFTLSPNQTKALEYKYTSGAAEKENKSDEIKKSLLLQNIDISKGIINDLAYSGEFDVVKKGSEIKEKFQEQAVLLSQRIDENNKKLVELATKIGALPTEPMPEYWASGLLSKMVNHPKLYNIGSKSGKDESLSNGNAPIPDDADLETLKCQFNETVRHIMNDSVEVIKLNTMMNNLKDSKEYRMSVSQATSLGF